MKYDRLDVFIKPVPAWKTRWKRAVLWLYEREVLSVSQTKWLIDLVGARLA
jgi:hypothetical protein